MIATRDMGYALAAFRLLLTQRLAPLLTSSSSSTINPPPPAAGQQAFSNTAATGEDTARQSVPEASSPAAAAGLTGAGSVVNMYQLVIGDPVLASFGSLLEDDLLLAAVQQQWQARCKEMCSVPVGGDGWTYAEVGTCNE